MFVGSFIFTISWPSNILSYRYAYVNTFFHSSALHQSMETYLMHFLLLGLTDFIDGIDLHFISSIQNGYQLNLNS